MATLQLTWEKSDKIFSLWSWNKPVTHSAARLRRKIGRRVYTALLGPLGAPPSQEIAVKLAHGNEEMDALKRETAFYENELRYLQGSVVPTFLGLYQATVNGKEFGCILMQLCPGPRIKDSLEMNRQIMLSACHLHQAGVTHNGFQDAHHFVGNGNSMCIVDFSKAARHKCIGGTPIVAEEKKGELPPACLELMHLEKNFGLYSGGGPHLKLVLGM